MGRVPLDESLADNGCELYARCLECPYAWCVEEAPGARLRRKSRVRSAQLARLKKAGGSSARLAAVFGVSVRTVQRALRKPRSKRKKST